MLPKFRAGGLCRPQFLRMTFLHLHGLGFGITPDVLDAAFQIYHGDLVALGKGEIFVRPLE